MKSKAPLALIELAVMLLVFSLAAALSVRVFVKSDHISKEGAALGQAVVFSENAAEAVSSCRGDLSKVSEILGGRSEDRYLYIGYDENWSETDTPVYVLQISITDNENKYLGTSDISVKRVEDETELFSLKAAWQKEE